MHMSNFFMMGGGWGNGWYGPSLLPIWIILAVWVLAWKAWALWIAARKGEKVWFGALLILNTLGILEILYIYVFSKMNEKGKLKG